MKWIGQNIYDQIARFRDDVYLEDISTGTIASGGNLGLDSNNKIVKAAEVGSDVSLTSEVSGILPVANGGTGASTFTDGGILIGNGTSRVDSTNVLGDGEILIGDGTTDPVALDVGSSTAITVLGTVATGVWQGTAVASGYTKHVLHYPFKGYATGLSSGNFQYSVNYQDAQSLFQLNFDYGATAIASGNLPDVSDWFRSSGTIMPRAVTATRVYGWMTCPTTNNVTIALCKITPTRNDNSAVVPIVVATTVIAAIDNDKMDFFDITASDAGAGTGSIVTSAIAQGDILMPFVISPNTKTTFFNLTLEVEA